MKNTDDAHVTVLLDEAVSALITDDNGFYVDATFGRGGHSSSILQRLSSQGSLLGLDKDQAAIYSVSQQLVHDERFELIQASFSQMKDLLAARDKCGDVAGILLDLGVSSPQLDHAERGFSFLHEGPLDMRMDRSQGQTAAEWINQSSETDIADVLKSYGEERFARRIARAITEARMAQAIETTKRLAEIVSAANPAWEKGKHPATRAFQAIRIYINRELDELDKLLNQVLDVLKVGGRLVVISFHSLEDRRVKRFIQFHEKGDSWPAKLPITQEHMNIRMRSLGKPVRSGASEVSNNPRARSAIMRVAEKIA